MAIRISQNVAITAFFVRGTDCHNQSADWFRNDVGFKELTDKQKFDNQKISSLLRSGARPLLRQAVWRSGRRT